MIKDSSGLLTATAFRPGWTARLIPVRANGQPALLVVGARGRAAYPGMLLGSVAEYCVRNGPCPVVVVRTPAK